MKLLVTVPEERIEEYRRDLYDPPRRGYTKWKVSAVEIEVKFSGEPDECQYTVEYPFDRCDFEVVED